MLLFFKFHILHCSHLQLTYWNKRRIDWLIDWLIDWWVGGTGSAVGRILWVRWRCAVVRRNHQLRRLAGISLQQIPLLVGCCSGCLWQRCDAEKRVNNPSLLPTALYDYYLKHLRYNGIYDDLYRSQWLYKVYSSLRWTRDAWCFMIDVFKRLTAWRNEVAFSRSVIGK